MSKQATHNQAKKDAWQPKGFVNLHLTESQLAHVWETFPDSDKIIGAFTNEMANGYRFTFSVDSKTGATVCTANCKDEASVNYGWLLSSFAPTYIEALCLTLYKHLVVLEAHWGDMETKATAAQYG